MPCYEVNLISVEFKVNNRKWLEAALKECGFTYWKTHSRGNVIEDVTFRIKLDTGVVEMDRNPNTAYKVNQLKQAYTKQAVMEAARKHKWAVKMNSTSKMELRRY